jgi:adenylyltransferase/sulfurtransferase
VDDAELLRYSRQILLPEFGIEGQEQLRASRVLIVGLGGLGSAAAMYLAAAGVGHLVLSDHDSVDLSNLQRQIIHGLADLGRAKVISARDRLKSINPLVEITTLSQRLDGDLLNRQVQLADVVLDATDNFASRFLLNEVCVEVGKPLVSGAAIRMEGQVSVFNLRPGESPCYRCLYQDLGELDESCTQTGILAPLVGIIGSIQALETIKVITGVAQALDGRLLLFDARGMDWHTVALQRSPGCPVCSRSRVDA